MSHILLVEDDVQFCQMLVQMLRRDGHEVAVAVNGLEALHVVERIAPDLIITDILMPKMDGIEIIIELARRGFNIPVIAMSGGRRAITAEFNLNSANVLGVAATLTKPFARADLREAIESALLTITATSPITS
jgi:CheY-like chemotaxis protein